MVFSTSSNKYEKGPMKNPWLIQRCKSGEFKPEMKASEYLRLDYMGSSEFEWGALPAFLREMGRKLDRLVIRLVEHNGQTLYILAENEQLDQYAQIVRDLIDDKIRLKERSGLKEKEILYVGKNRTPMYDQPHAPYSFDCFWDITNGLAFARDIQTLLNLKIAVKNSVRFMVNVEKR